MVEDKQAYYVCRVCGAFISYELLKKIGTGRPFENHHEDCKIEDKIDFGKFNRMIAYLETGVFNRGSLVLEIDENKEYILNDDGSDVMPLKKKVSGWSQMV
jgi:hypothetical protein